MAELVQVMMLQVIDGDAQEKIAAVNEVLVEFQMANNEVRILNTQWLNAQDFHVTFRVQVDPNSPLKQPDPRIILTKPSQPQGQPSPQMVEAGRLRA